MNDERDTQVGYGRTQPEFSLGERMAAAEAHQRSDTAHRKEVSGLEEKLVDEKLKSVRQEMATKDTAAKEAITKAEKAAAEQATALATELRQFTDQAQTRFGALERGGAGMSAEKLGAGEFEARGLALRAAQTANRAVAAAVVTGCFGAVGIIVAIIKSLGG